MGDIVFWAKLFLLYFRLWIYIYVYIYIYKKNKKKTSWYTLSMDVNEIEDCVIDYGVEDNTSAPKPKIEFYIKKKIKHKI